MTNYSIEIVSAEGQDMTILPMQGVRTDNGAVKRLRSFLKSVAPYDYPGKQIYLHFFRQSDQTSGYINPDGASHEAFLGVSQLLATRSQGSFIECSGGRAFG